MILAVKKRRARAARLPAVAIGLAMCMALVPGPAFAADLRVPGQFPTIQAALDAAAPGDRILVDPGVYPERLDFHQQDVRLESTGGPGVTSIDLTGIGGTAVTIGPGGALVGFTVTGASESFGAGMSVSGAGTLVQGNVFASNLQQAGGFGAAIGGNSASPVIDRNLFRGNSCDAQFLSGVVSFINGSSPLITNNRFQHNPCRAINLTLPVEAAPVVANNTMVDNAVGIRVDARIETAGQTYRNNLVVGNQIGLQVDFGDPTRSPIWEHNLVFGNTSNYAGITDQTGRAGNLAADPLFVDPAQDDYHLRSGSPAVDAGTSLSAPATDFDGNPRPLDGDGDGQAVVDIGAYERQPGAVLRVAIDIRPGNSTNRIRLGSTEPVPVAILSAPDFDAVTQVDRDSLTFGRTGNEPSLSRCNRRGSDVNGDGRADLVCYFQTRLTGFQLGDTRGILKGTTVDGTRFEGEDSVLIVR